VAATVGLSHPREETSTFAGSLHQEAMPSAVQMPLVGRHAREPRRSRALAVALATVALTAPLRCGLTFAMQPGWTKKQQRGTMHNKDRLPTQYEVPLETPEPELEAAEPEPERRLPYTMNVILQFADESRPSSKYVQQKITQALENTESMIRNVDVRVQRLDHFHREKPGRPHRLAAEDLEDGPVMLSSKDSTGADALAPYQLKVKVDLKNNRQVILSNPEKHAQPTLTEAVDHAVDVLRKLMREEKEKEIGQMRKRHEDGEEIEADLLSDAEWEEDSYVSASDKEAEAMYQAVEAAEEGEEAAAAAEPAPPAGEP